MKIAVVQMLYRKGHRVLDQGYVRLLSKDHHITIIDDGKHFPENFCNEIGAEHYVVHPLMIKRCEFLKRLLHYFNLIVVLLTIKFHKVDCDAMLFVNVHNALYFITKLLPRKKIVIFHHEDIDAMLEYPKYVNQFDKVKNELYHICLAGFISEGLIKSTGVSPERVYTVYQPVVFDKQKNNVQKENLLIGIGNSTDESVIEALVKQDKHTESKTVMNRIVMRSRKMEYSGDNVSVISGFLPRDEYELLYDRAKVSIVTYPSRYKLRYSGIIDDSLSKGLIVFANDNPCSNYFASKYPSCVKIFHNTRELWEMSQDILPIAEQSEIVKFSHLHSLENVRKQLNIVFEA